MLIKPLRWVFKFAVAELRHEWLFAVGVSLAVCSVLTPTMLLWGVKNGLVTSLRQRLTRDPKVRDIHASKTLNITRSWIESMRQRPETEFIVPSVRQISLYGRVRLANGAWLQLDEILPSAEGDPLGNDPQMSWHSETLPVPCMISEEVARSLRAKEEDKIFLETTRTGADGKQEIKQLEGLIRKVIPQTLSPRTTLYVPVGVVERIEDYKDGQNVPAFQGAGTSDTSFRRYHGCAIRFKNDEEPHNPDRLKSLFPGADVRRLPRDELARHMHCPEGSPSSLWVIEYPDPGFNQEKFDMLTHEAGGQILGLLPYTLPTASDLQDAAGSTIARITLRTTSVQWYSIEETKALLTTVQAKPPSEGESAFNFRVETDKTTSSLKLLSKHKPQDVLEVNPAQAGLIGAALRRPLHYNEVKGTITFERLYYGGFRFYARTIDDVATLRAECEREGIEVETQDAKIQQVKMLDQSLSKLVTLIASLSVLGGFGALFASLYLSVERGKRQFSVLRVFGIPSSLMLLSILVQSAILTSIGTFLATGLYLAGSVTLQNFFGGTLQKGEIFCQLDLAQMEMLWLCGLLAGLLAGYLASFRLRGMDAAAVARGE